MWSLPHLQRLTVFCSQESQPRSDQPQELDGRLNSLSNLGSIDSGSPGSHSLGSDSLDSQGTTSPKSPSQGAAATPTVSAASAATALATKSFLSTSRTSPNRGVGKIDGLSQTSCSVVHLVKQLPVEKQAFDI